MLFARIIHALCEAELVRGIFFGEGGLNSQQWGIVSIRRVQPPGSAAEPLNCPIHWIQRPFASFCLRNQPLREAYCIEKQLMLRERGEDQVNEQLLLHGHLMRSHFNMVWTWCNCTSLQLDIPASANVCSRYFSSDLHNYHAKIIAGCLRLPHVETLFEGTRTFDPVAIIEDRDGFMVEKGCVMYWQRID